MSRRRSGSKLAAVVLLALVAGACDRGHDLTYQQASKELAALIDDSLAVGLNGKPPPPKPEVVQHICSDDKAASKGEVEPSYDYYFPIDFLGPNPDAERFMDAVGKLWQERGLGVERSDKPGVLESFGAGRGFALNAFVSFNNKMVQVAGSGPCTEGPPKPPLDLDGP